MSRRLALTYVGALALTLLLTARASVDAGVFVLEHRASERVELAVAGWLIATLAPFALSIFFWLLQRRLGAPLWLHLLFFPCALALINAGTTMVLTAADVPDDSSVEGWALFMADFLTLLTLCIHAAALVSAWARKMRREAEEAAGE